MGEIHVRAPLFDRLTDFDPWTGEERRPLRTFGRDELLESVRRELERLLNTRSSLPVDRLEEREDLTVLEYGIPDLSAFSAGEPEDQKRLAGVVTRAVTAFEPRLRDVRTVFERLDATGREVQLRVDAVLTLDEVREPVSFPTIFTVKTGEARVGVHNG